MLTKSGWGSGEWNHSVKFCFLLCQQVTKNMAGVVKSMEAATRSMDLQKVRIATTPICVDRSNLSKLYHWWQEAPSEVDSCQAPSLARGNGDCEFYFMQVQTLMDRFETQFENLDVQTQVMEGAMQDSSTLSTPQNEVDSLMQQVADEAGWEKKSTTIIATYALPQLRWRNYRKLCTWVSLVVEPNVTCFRLELNMDLPSAQTSTIGTATAASQEQVLVACSSFFLVHKQSTSRTKPLFTFICCRCWSVTSVLNRN